MTVKPDAFLSFAKRLLRIETVGLTEARIRTVVNRSYLACVLYAAGILEPLVGPLPSDHRFYGAVEAALVSRSADSSKDKLFDLRRRRRAADYALDTDIRLPYAEESVAIADYLFNLLPQEIA